MKLSTEQEMSCRVLNFLKETRQTKNIFEKNKVSFVVVVAKALLNHHLQVMINLQMIN